MEQNNEKWEEELSREFGTMTSGGEYIIADRPNEIVEFIRSKLQEARNAALEEAVSAIVNNCNSPKLVSKLTEAIRALKKEEIS